MSVEARGSQDASFLGVCMNTWLNEDSDRNWLAGAPLYLQPGTRGSFSKFTGAGTLAWGT